MKNFFLLLFFYILIIPFYCQENEGIPPSPSVASLVSIEKDSINSTGTLVQSISLANFKIGKYVFPINLLYSSKGILVEETSSYVGTGWNLSGGGVITRSVMDLPDDLINLDVGKGILHTNILNEIYDMENTQSSGNLSLAEQSDFFEIQVSDFDADGKRNDTQPDIFYFNMFGVEGKFLFNKNKEIVGFKNDNSKYNYTLGIDNTIETFTIIDSKGIKYLFSEREYSETHFIGSFGGYYVSPKIVSQRFLNYHSSWHLKTITTPDNYVVTFSYDNETIEYTTRSSVMGKLCGENSQCDEGSSNYDNLDILNLTKGNFTEFKVYSKKMKQIISESFQVDFDNTPRDDLDGGLKLSKLTISNSSSQVINKYDFEYSYFNSQGSSDASIYETKRLKLNKIKKNDDYLNEFTYYEDFVLPNRKSTEQDFWGYYNKNNSPSLIPKVYLTYDQLPYKYHVFQPLNSNTYLTIGQIDRNSNPNYTHMGMLKSIEYKTAGKKTFTYEPNEFTHTDYTNISNPTIKGNGVRLQKIDYFDGQNTETTNYNYNLSSTGISSGRLSYLPNFAIHIPWEFSIRESPNNIHFPSPSYPFTWYISTPDRDIGFRHIQTAQTDNLGRYIYCSEEIYNDVRNYTPNNYPAKYFNLTTRRFSMTQIPLSQNQDNQFAYKSIKVTELNNGSKEYFFNITGALDEAITPGEDNLFKNRSANSVFAWSFSPGSSLYDCNGSTMSKFYNMLTDLYYDYVPYLDLTGNSHPFTPKPNWNQHFGVIDSFVYRNESGFKVYKQDYIYELVGNLENSNDKKTVIGLKYKLFNYLEELGWSFGSNGGPYAEDKGPKTTPLVYLWAFYDKYYGNGLVLKQSKNTFYFENESKSVTTTIDNDFRSGNFMDRSETITSDGSTLTTKFKYPIDFAIGGNVYEKMVNKNMLYTPIEIIKIKNENKVSAEVTAFQETINGIYPAKKSVLYKLISSNYNGASANSNGLVLHNDYEDQIFYDSFDKRGNLLEYHNKANITSTLLWGYNREYPIAKLENITYSEAENIYHSQSNKYLSSLSTSSRFDQENFRNDLNNFKDVIYSQKSDVNITTYTFKPMVGVTSISDSRANTVNFNYDSFNRLKNNKDLDGNLIQDFKYNYKNKDLLQINNPVIVPSFSIVAVPNSYSSPIPPDTAPNSICFNGTVFTNSIQLSTSNPQIGSQIMIDEINATPSHVQNKWGSFYSGGIRWIRFYGQNDSLIWDVNPSTGVITGVSVYNCN